MPNVELREQQITALERLKNGNILAGGVGSGKSRVAIAWYIRRIGGSFRFNNEGRTEPGSDPKDLYIITTARKRDSLEWVEELARFGRGLSAVSNPEGIVVVIDSWNNISKYSMVRDAVFIFDEQRLVGSGTWVKSFLKITESNAWILLSATPGDVWLDYCPVFIANGFYKNRQAFKEHHVVYSYQRRFPQVSRYVGTKRLERLRDSILVDMPVERHTKRIDHLETVDFNVGFYKDAVKKRWDPYVGAPVQDIAGLFRVMRRIVNSDPSRYMRLVELFKKHKKVIVFYNFDYELEILRYLGEDLGVDLAEWNGHKHQDIPSSDSWIYLVQYSAGAEAWNCVSTDAMIFYSLSYSYKLLEQAKGRIDRLNTPFIDLHYYILMSKSPIDMAIWGKLKEKKSFNERKEAKKWA